MRKIALAGATILLSASLLSPTQASAVDTVDTQKLRDAVTVSGILQHERAFQNIANNNEGIRASGTPGFDASADYVAKKLRQAGYKVKRQAFTFPFFRDVEPPELSEVSPNARDIETATFTYSGSGEIQGLVIPTTDIQIPPGDAPSSSNSGCEPADFTQAPDDHSIALIQRGTCTFEDKVINAKAAGYAAVIIFNEGQEGRRELLTGTLGNPQTIPAVGISFADGEALYEETQAGDVTARVFTSTETDLNRETVNIIADSPEGKIKGQTIVVGAHLDSVTQGPGINDNGSGSSTILEIAEQLAALKYTNKLQRQVRFAFWGAEEPGLYGSEHYVTNLTDAQRAKIYANLNFDMVGSPNYVRFVYDGDGSLDPDLAGPPGSDSIEEVFTKYFADQGLASEPTEFDGRSDYGPFIAAGIPAGGLFSGAEGIKTGEQATVYGGTAGVAYDKCYHQACDTINNLNSKALFELGDAAAHATLTLALSKTGLFPTAAGRLKSR